MTQSSQTDIACLIVGRGKYCENFVVPRGFHQEMPEFRIILETIKRFSRNDANYADLLTAKRKN
jgi:hypothetical protein